MAAGYLSPPGVDNGPCRDACKHVDCAETREMSTVSCEICGKPIGYGKNFYQAETWTKLTHAVCLETQIEEEAKR